MEDSTGKMCHCCHSRAMGRPPDRRDKSEDLPYSYIVLKFSGNKTSKQQIAVFFAQRLNVERAARRICWTVFSPTYLSFFYAQISFNSDF